MRLEKEQKVLQRTKQKKDSKMTHILTQGDCKNESAIVGIVGLSSGCFGRSGILTLIWNL